MRSAWPFVFLAILTSLPAPSRVITSAVGRVKDHIVTSREVQINNTIDQALMTAKPEKIKVPRDPDSAQFAKLVTGVLLEWVVHFEAKNMAVANISPGEVTSSATLVKSRLAKIDAWKALKVSNNELNEMIGRKLQAKKFIRFRADSSVVPISDAEAQRYFEANRLKFGDQSFDSFRGQIKNFLSRQQVERRLKDWFEVLQAKYQVRNFLAEI